MSAPACVVFFGLRFELAEHEVEGLKTRSDLRIAAAQKAGLKIYWAKFNQLTERYFLLLGEKIGVFGPEDASSPTVPSEDLLATVSTTKKRLRDGGFDGDPKLIVEWLSDP